MPIDYSKFDKIADEATAAAAPLTTPTRFDFGDGDFVPRDVQYYEEKEIAAARGVPMHANEVWQVVVKKLRCYVGVTTPVPGAPEGNLVPVRPYSILVAMLYPAGRMIVHHVCSPPNSYPNSKEVLSHVLRAILEPPEGTPQHRPGKVVFAEKELAASCAKSLATLEAETSVLSEAPELADVVLGLSRLLASKEIATINPASSRPGMAGQPGVTRDVLRCFFRLANELALKQPWMRIMERQTFRLTSDVEVRPDAANDGVMVPAGSVWVSVMGESSLRALQDALKAKRQPPPIVRGIALFSKRYDAEQRLLAGAKDVVTTHGVTLPVDGPVVAAPNPYDLVCALPSCGKTPEGDGSELPRCSRCKEVYYCNKECQRLDWPRHAPTCKQRAIIEAAADGSSSARAGKAAERYWAVRECVVLFEGPVPVPFDDLDAMDSLGLEPNTLLDFPIAVTYNKGVPSRPTLADLVWIMRALAAVPAIMEQFPEQVSDLAAMKKAMPLSFVKGINVEGGHWYDVIHDYPELQMRTDPILTKVEYGRLLELVQKNKEAVAAAAAAAATAAAASGAAVLEDSESDVATAAAAGGAAESATPSATGGEGGKENCTMM